MAPLDFGGADGGRLALAFAAGCAAAWAFIKAFVSSPVQKALEKRIGQLEADNERCEERTTRLETLLWMHGPQQLRQDIQKSMSDAHLDLLREIDKATKARDEA